MRVPWIGGLLPQLQRRGGRVQHGADGEARQQHVLHGKVTARAGQLPDDGHGQQRAGEGQQLGRAHSGKCQHGQKEDGNRAAQRRAARCAQHEGIGQRVAKQSLKKHSGSRERGADQSGGEHARQAQGEQNDSGVSGRRWMQQRAQHVGGRELHRAHPRRDDDRQQQQYGRKRKGEQRARTRGESRSFLRRYRRPSWRPSWVQNFQLSPPNLNSTPERMVKGSAG